MRRAGFNEWQWVCFKSPAEVFSSDVAQNNCSTKYQAQWVVKIFKKYPWMSSFLLKLHSYYQVCWTVDLQNKAKSIQYTTALCRRDSKSVTFLFSYFDWGSEHMYFTHLGPICTTSNSFFSAIHFVQYYKQYSYYSFKKSYVRLVSCD